MSFSTYADLQTQIANWLARSDLTTYIPDFITLFEARAARKLHLRQNTTTATLTPVNGSVALPTDYLASRRLTWTGSTRVDLEYVHPSWLQTAYPTSPTDIPRVWTIEGANILIRPIDPTALEFLYVQRTAAVSTSLNWLYTNYPDAYLFGSLAEAHGFQIDPENLAIWEARRDKVFEELNSNDFHQRAQMTIRVWGHTP